MSSGEDMPAYDREEAGAADNGDECATAKKREPNNTI